MQAFAAVLIMLGIMAVGHLLLTATRLRPRLSWGGDLVIAFLIGTGVTTLLGFWVSLAAASTGLMVSLIATAVALLVVIGMLAKRLLPLLAWRPRMSLSTVAATPGGALLAFAMWVKRDGVMVWGAAATAVMVWTVASSIRLRQMIWVRLPWRDVIRAAG